MDGNKIVWKNIYYMLTYSIDELAHMNPADADLEKCKSLDDLLSALMCKAVELLYENNFLNEYNKVRKITDKPRGNILIQKSYESEVSASGKLCCEYFELNINSQCNIIIKSAINSLIEYGKGLSRSSTSRLLTILEDFQSIDNIDSTEINFEDIDYNDLPEWYKPVIIVSKLIINELIGKDRNGAIRLFRLDDNERLKYIFEKFVRNFYIQGYSKEAKTTHPVYRLYSRINKLDMLLENDKAALIIDTKWYESKNFRTSRVANEREVTDYILSYKENEKSTTLNDRKETYGVILYARTDENESTLTREEIRSLGNDYGECVIYERTLNLNQSFDDIKTDLINLANELLK